MRKVVLKRYVIHAENQDRDDLNEADLRLEDKEEVISVETNAATRPTFTVVTIRPEWQSSSPSTKAKRS